MPPVHPLAVAGFRLRRDTALLILLSLVVHAGFAGLLTLSVDEAHYALYAARPALSYFDHPPLVGWVQWPLVALGSADWILRLIPQALWLATVLLAWELAETLRARIPGWSALCGPGEAGHWATLLVVLGPVFHVLAVGLLPDTLLMVWVLALMRTGVALSDPRPGRRLGLWLWLGLLLGLAGLSKYTAILFAVALLGLLGLTLGWRWMVTPGPWIAAVVALALVSPVFYWNWLNDWLSFKYQIGHSSGGRWRAHRLLSFVGLQLVAFGPLVIVATVAASQAVKRQRSRLLVGLGLFFVLPLAVTAFLSGGGRTLPHWMAPAWLAVIVLGAAPLAAAWRSGKRKLLASLAGLQAALCGLAFVALFFVGVPGVDETHALGRKNPLADLWGWDLAGERAKQIAQQRQLQTLTVGNWTLGSRLAWYARPLSVIVLDQRRDQFDLWFGELKPQQNALFVNWSQVAQRLPVGDGQFQSCTPISALAIERLGRIVSRFEFFECRHWQGAAP